MFSDQEVAQRGWHILPLGCILVVAMAFAAWASDLPLAAAQAEDTTFPGTATMAWVLLGGFASIAMMGLAIVVAAAQMILGYSSRVAAIAMILLFVLGSVLIGVAVVAASSTVMSASGSER
jgi:hypothetical protein